MTTLLCAVALAGCAAAASALRAAGGAAPSSPSSCRARGHGIYTLPDPRCTPGAVTPAVTQANIGSTICRYGYTRRVRPPERVSESEKRQSMAAYGDAGPLHDYEYDHLIPLELGGAPNDPRNLWPEPAGRRARRPTERGWMPSGRLARGTPNPKDELERTLNRLVCGHRLSLAAARREIATDWVAALRRDGA